MASAPHAIRLTLQISADEKTDADELDRLTRQPRDEIQELEVESVALATEEHLPSGAKAAEPLTLGALTLGIMPEVLPKLLGFLRGRLRAGHHKVKIKTQVGDRSLEVEYTPQTISSAELRGLVEMLTGALTEKKPQDTGTLC